MSDAISETKVCPKCKGEMIRGEECSHVWKNSSQRTFIGSTVYHTFACSNCGFMESYLEKRN